MTLKLNDIAPDFTQDSTEGKLHFHDWIEGHWVVFFSHPKDFTPVCTTELGAVARLKPEFDKRGVKVLGLSVDPADSHAGWSKDIEETQGVAPNFPMIADTDLSVSKLYGMLPADTQGTSEGRTPATNATVRNVFIIGPDKQIKLILVYPMTTGRNFNEIIRVIDSMQLTAKHKVATPADWEQGQDVILTGAVSDEEAKAKFPGFVTLKPYLRTAKQPGLNFPAAMSQPAGAARLGGINPSWSPQ
ncbi:MAG TPA: peroxiredoxin [Phenylobacterium sp.]